LIHVRIYIRISSSNNPFFFSIAKVQGSFKDVRAPLLTIESLQSLISLPLVRPDLFKRGILKKNFIPGVLLFGPPGTGKVNVQLFKKLIYIYLY
jgi:ATP-dependent 26S proteasome regulatory subunit